MSKWGSVIIISHPNQGDVWILGDDSYDVQYQGYDGEVSIDISDDFGLTWGHITNYTPPVGETGLHTCHPMIDGSPSEYTRLRITATADRNITGTSDFFNTPYE